MFKPTSDWKNHKITDMITFSQENDPVDIGKILKNYTNIIQEICERIISSLSNVGIVLLSEADAAP